MTPSVVLIPGWAHPAESLRPLIAALEPAFAVHCVSAHELQEKKAPWLERQPPNTLLAGWSMGGIMALEAAAARPENIAGLIMLSSTARFCSDAGYPCGVEPHNLRTMRAGLERAPARILGRFFDQVCAPLKPAPEAREAFVSDALGLGLPALANGLDYLAAADLRPRLASIKIPVLLVHGEADAVIPCGASAYLAKNLPSATLVTKAGVGHNAPFAALSFVSEAIHAFAKRVLG